MIRIYVDAQLVREVVDFAIGELEFPRKITVEAASDDRKKLNAIKRASLASRSNIQLQGDEQYIFSYWADKYQKRNIEHIEKLQCDAQIKP